MGKTIKRLVVFMLTLIMISSALPLTSFAADWIPSNVKSAVFDAKYYADRYADLKAAFGSNANSLYNHYLNYGAREGRQASPIFCSSYYTTKNVDLKAAFGTDYVRGTKHYGSNGYKESGRVTAEPANLGQSFEARITASSGMAVTVSGTNVNINTPVVRNNSQIWVFTRHSDGSYCITNKSTGKAMDVAGASTASGTNIQIYNSNGTNAQRWFLFKYSTDKYVLRTKATPLCVLDVKGGSSSAGTNIQNSTYNGSNAQIFTIKNIKDTIEGAAPVNMGDNFYARIMGLTSEKYLIADTDSNVEINAAANDKSQYWQFIRNSDGSYTIKNKKNGKVLDVSNASYNSGANIWTYTSNSSNAQRWFIYSVNGHYAISPKCAPQCVIDISNNSTANGANAHSYKYNGSGAQLFDILPVNGVVENIVWSSTSVITVYAGQTVDLSGYHVQFASGKKIIAKENITWTSSQLALDADYCFTAPATGKYVVVAKNGSTTKNITISVVAPKTILYQVAPDKDMLMNCYVIKTINNKLIVIDGGGSVTSNTGYLYEKLQEISGQEVPQVEAWFLTHLHDDHVTEFNSLVKDSSKKIDIKNVYFNLPSKKFMNSSESGKYSYLFDDVKASYDKLYGAGSFDAIGGKNVFEGDVIEIDGVKIDILLTVTDEEKESNINDTSLIFKATIAGNTVMFLADTYIHEGQRLLDKYGSALKSDVVQVSHHGQNGVRQNVYQAIDPDVCLWPSPIWVFNNHPGIYQTPEVRNWMKALGVKYHYVTGVSLTQSISFPLNYSTLNQMNI